MSQIATLIFSSRNTIRKALIDFDIPIRDRKTPPERHGNPPFGKRKIKGTNIIFKKEREVIESIVDMHKDGHSNRAIAIILTQMKLPTKKKKNKWHHEMVRQILIREGKYNPKHKKFGGKDV